MGERQPLGDFLATKDESFHAQIIALDAAIVKAAPGVDAAIKWRQYMYSFGAKWMDPLCTIDTTKKGIALRFMGARSMSDPLGVFRFGESSMGTWDIPAGEKVKAADITRYVKEAVKIRNKESK